jgi:endonuclease/exonuclease/phosphatase family metal-dependent hydrolase
MDDNVVEISIMTFNTANDFIAADDLVEVLSSSGADVIGLQELSIHNSSVLETSLLSEYPFRVLFGKQFDGKGLLSRYPIEKHRLFSSYITRPHIEAVLKVGDQKVVVYVVHAPAPNFRRLEIRSPYSAPEIERLLDLIQLDVPTIALGDFNLIDRSEVCRSIAKAGLIDTFRAAGKGLGLTFPTRFQYLPILLPRLVRIDYIWVTKHFTPLSSVVGHGWGSDHLPVISKVALIPSPVAKME